MSSPRFHLEAAIAAEHCRAASFEETDWRRIMEMYDILVAIAPAPLVALNRAIMRGQVDGPAAGLAALDALGAGEFFHSYPFFHAALGEFRARNGQSSKATVAFKKALDCARSSGERTFFARRLNQLRESPGV